MESRISVRHVQEQKCLDSTKLVSGEQAARAKGTADIPKSLVIFDCLLWGGDQVAPAQGSKAHMSLPAELVLILANNY